MYRMRRMFIILPLLLIAIVAFAAPALSSDPLIEKLKEKGFLSEEEVIEIEKKKEKDYKLPKALKDLKFGVKAYVDYSAGSKLSSGNRESYNEFGLTRGYITIKKKLNPGFLCAQQLMQNMKQKETQAPSYMEVLSQGLNTIMHSSTGLILVF